MSPWRPVASRPDCSGEDVKRYWLGHYLKKSAFIHFKAADESDEYECNQEVSKYRTAPTDSAVSWYSHTMPTKKYLLILEDFEDLAERTRCNTELRRRHILCAETLALVLSQLQAVFRIVDCLKVWLCLFLVSFEEEILVGLSTYRFWT